MSHLLRSKNHKVHFYLNFNPLVNSLLFRSVKKGEIFSKQLNSLHFYEYQFVSNSHLLVLCREQRHYKNYGNATNWNNTGYFEFDNSLSKYR